MLFQKEKAERDGNGLPLAYDIAMARKGMWIRLVSVFLFFYMGDAFLTSYFGLYFLSRGMNETERSVLLAVIPLALFLGCFLLSPLAKSRNASLWLFRICGILEVGLCLGYAFCSSFTSLIVLTAIIGFCNGAPFPFLDGYATPLAKENGYNYGYVRMFGTIGYFAALTLGFLILSWLPISDCYFFASGLFAFAVALSFLLPKVRSEETPQENLVIEKPKRKLFCKGFILILVIDSLFYGVFVASAYLIPVHLSELGLANQNYSLIRGLGMVVELVGFLLMPLFAKKFRSKVTPIVIGVILCSISAGLCLFDTEPWSLAFLNLCICGFGKSFWLAFQTIVAEKVVGPEQLGKALTIGIGVTNLTSSLFNLLSGWAADFMGFPAFFGILGGLQLLSLIAVFFLSRYLKKVDASATLPNELHE